MTYPTVGDTFKQVFNVQPTPEREREITDELIERQAKRITELERETAELRNQLNKFLTGEAK